MPPRTLILQLIDPPRETFLKGRFVLILPEKLVPFFDNNECDLEVKRDDEHLRLGIFKIIRRRTAPLGRVMEMEWATHIGGDKDEYIKNAKRIYNIFLTDSSMVQVLVLEPL